MYMCTFVSSLFINNSKTYYGCPKKVNEKKTMANYYIKEVG
jgi:hypothetical protein